MLRKSKPYRAPYVTEPTVSYSVPYSTEFVRLYYLHECRSLKRTQAQKTGLGIGRKHPTLRRSDFVVVPDSEVAGVYAGSWRTLAFQRTGFDGCQSDLIKLPLSYTMWSLKEKLHMEWHITGFATRATCEWTPCTLNFKLTSVRSFKLKGIWLLIAVFRFYLKDFEF